MKVVQDTVSKKCQHELLIRVHGSMITGRSRNHNPNPNHICHYCVACGKWLREDEIMPEAFELDFFKHPDAIEQFSEEIKPKINDMKVPEKYIKRS